MNIFKVQKTYMFRTPKYSPLLAPILMKISDVFFLHKKFNVRKVTFEGVDKVAELIKANQSILIAPNHADPHVLLHISRKLGLPFHFMTARESFEHNRWLNSFVLQHSGAFSIDREGVSN